MLDVLWTWFHFWNLPKFNIPIKNIHLESNIIKVNSGKSNYTQKSDDWEGDYLFDTTTYLA